MEVNATDFGLGIGAFVTSVLAWLKLRPKLKPELDFDMTSVLSRISNLEGGQRHLNDSIKALTRETLLHVSHTQGDIKEVKSDIKDLKDILLEVQKSTSRMEGHYEAQFERIARSAHPTKHDCDD